MSLKQSAVKGVKWTTLSTAVSAVFQVVQLTALARLLKPEDFGLMAMVMVIIGFAQAYADMGVSAAVVHKQEVSRDQLSSLYWLNLVSGAVVYLALCAATPLIVLFFHEQRLYQLMPIVALSFPIASTGLQFLWLLEKELKFDLLAKQEILSTLLGTAVAITCACLGQGVWSLVFGQLAAAVSKAVLLNMVGWRRWTPHLHFRKSDLQGFIGFGLYQMGERSVNYFNSRVDQILIGSLLGAQELGYYNFAFNLVIAPVARINPTLTRVAFPVFAKMQNDLPRLQGGYVKLMNLVSSINAPLLFGLSAVAPLFIPLVFGSKWIPAVTLVQVLSLYAFMRSTGNPIGSLLLARGRADLGFRWNVALLFVVAPFVYLGAKVGAATGIAITLLLLQICLSVACYRYLVKPLVGPCASPYFLAILKPVGVALVMGAAVYAITTIAATSISWLVVEIVFGAVVYIAILSRFAPDLFVELKSFMRGA